MDPPSGYHTIVLSTEPELPIYTAKFVLFRIPIDFLEKTHLAHSNIAIDRMLCIRFLIKTDKTDIFTHIKTLAHASEHRWSVNSLSLSHVRSNTVFYI